MKLLRSTGEACGDTYGAQHIDALRQLSPGTTFFGMGGEKMRGNGCEVLIDAKEVAVVGLAEVVTHLPGIFARFNRFVAEAQTRRPDAAVLIDFPEFNLRLARKLHGLGIPVFYFVSPQIWAWRTGRVKQIKKYVREMIVIFPFEQEFYRKHGVEGSYVGHPLAHAEAPVISRTQFPGRYGLDATNQWIGLLPCSRRTELRLNLPTTLEAAQLLQNKDAYEFVLPVASTLDADWMRQRIPASAPHVPIHPPHNSPLPLPPSPPPLFPI